MFPVNVWYVACKSEEVSDKPLGRTICSERMVFFRNSDGGVSALEDFCPHRGAPLSLGSVCEGKLTCGYHGLQVDGSGTPVSMPDQRVRGFPSVRAYPAVERYGYIWVWPGEAGKADPASLPELHWANNSAWAFGGGMCHIKSDYRLMIDNLMDLTHETYVHANSIGQKEIDETPCTTRTEGDEVITSRFMSGIMAPPFLQMALRGNGLPDDQLVDRWQVCHFTPPSHIMIEIGVALAGNGGYNAPAEVKASAVVIDFITPETPTSHWYFWGMARNFKAGDAELTERIRKGQEIIFAEDKVVLERQQDNLSHWPDRKLLMLKIDNGGIQSRKVLDRVIAADSVG